MLKMSLISQNIEQLKKDIADICKSYGRKPSEIKVVAVSKTKPVEMIKQAYQTGIHDFGENYVQEADQKYQLLKETGIKWHFIGPIQTNKVKYLTKSCNLLHSLDRKSLADALNKRLESEGKNLDCLIQVNTSGETTKSGVHPDKLFELAEHISKLGRLKVRGLMTIAENTSDEKSIRENYKLLKKLLKELKVKDYANFYPKELSMGMSGDYKIAIEEGATIIRIGSTIFGKREKKK